MRLAGAALLLALHVGCPGRVPSHLAPPPEVAPQTQAIGEIDDLDGLLLALVGRDPLGRAPTEVSADIARQVDGGGPYAALLEATAGLGPGDDEALRAVRSLESAHRGTPIVALARGARLREIEGVAGSSSPVNDAAQSRILELLTPLSNTARQDALPRRPMAWLAGDQPLQPALLSAGDRWVLSGWMDGPGTDLQPVADALAASPFDALRGTPAARLVLARAAGADDPPDEGLADLERASRGLLLEAVDDDKRGRERSAAFWRDVADELASDVPRDALLDRARQRLTDGASLSPGAGGALLALHAQRLWGRCPTKPCVGLDRVDAIRASGRWDPRVAAYARRLEVAALHEAIDGMEVARGTVRYPNAAIDLIDALVGTGAVPPDALVLRQRSPDASTWLNLGRSVGAESCTTWEETEVALRTWVADLATTALSDESDPDVRAALERVIKRGGR